MKAPVAELKCLEGGYVLGNFLKIDNSVVCFIKHLNSACFIYGK